MTLAEFESRFGTEEACADYLFEVRWPKGFRCPRCEGCKAWPVRERFLWQCAACGYQVSVTAGTVFERTRKPLTLWFRAIWWVSVQKNGASALGLQRVLGLGSYPTAWTWLHKLRRAMVRPGRDRLTGRVEVDETYIGGEKPGPRGRGANRKMLVVIAAQESGRGIGRIRMRHITNPSRAILRDFIEASVEPGTTVHTDGWSGYRGLQDRGYQHEVTMLNRASEPASTLLPRVHRVASLLQRWLLGTHQGAVSPRHLEYYLDEFTFRFNRRTSRHRGKLFCRLIQNAVDVEPAPYRELVRAGSRRRSNHKI